MSVIDVLKAHNLEAFQEINKMIESGTKKIAIPRATGSGKTYLVGALAEKYNDDRKLVLEPSRPLLNDIEEKFDEFGIDNTDFLTYQKLVRMSDEDITAMDYKLIFLDEFHHGTAPKWGEKIEILMVAHPDSIICGTSATTVRSDGVDVVDALFDGNAIDELSLSTAIAKKVLPCPTYVTAIYRLDDELDRLKKKVEKSTNTKEEKKEFLEKMQAMKNHFEKSYGVPTILNKYIKVKNGKYLVFCKDRDHLDTMRDVVIDWFRVAGIKNIHSYAVYSDYPDKEKDYKDFCEDNSDSAKILFSINMLNEGLHIENISGVVMLRTTMSDILYRQQLGRVLEAGNLDKYLVVFDFVNNFSSAGDGAGLLKEIKDAVAKEKESNPNFDDSGFEDIDTFFVLDQVIEIQEMFKEIEKLLQEIKNDWTKEEIIILERNFCEIGAMGIVKQKLIPRHNYGSIKEKAYELGLKYQNSVKYIPCDEDDKVLIENYHIYGKKIIKLLPHMTLNQIKHRVKQLGLFFDNKWKEEEKQILYDNYIKCSIKEMIELLPNKTMGSIISMASKLGLTNKKYEDWTNEEDELLKIKYVEIGSKCFDLFPNKTKSQCYHRAKKLDLLGGRGASKYRYVSKYKDKYRVCFLVDGKVKTFGTFKNEDEAAKVAMEKAKEYGKAI